MYHRQELEQPPSFTYLSQQPTNHNPAPNLNPYFSYSQSVLHFAEATIHPPGTDPYADPGSYSLTHLGFEGQTQYYEDPNAGSSTWVTRQAAPITYESGSVVSTSLSSSGNGCWTNQSLVSDVTKRISNIQPLRCEVCNIDCNSKDVFEKHISGKKHQRNMQNPTAATIKNASSSKGKMTSGALGVTTGKDLEIKRQKLLNGGAAVDSVMVCTICNIACNGEEMYKKHLYGKKHAAQAGLVSLNGVGQYFAAIKAQNNSFWDRVQKKTKVVQSAWCEICKINCNSNDVYVKHLQGKKHQKNLENLEKSKNGTTAPPSIAPPAATNLTIGPVENPEAKKSKSVDSEKVEKRSVESQSTTEDLETKKRKVVEGGAAASAVRVCTVCNVVCNSQTVYNFHLAGQKHAAMLKK